MFVSRLVLLEVEDAKNDLPNILSLSSDWISINLFRPTLAGQGRVTRDRCYDFLYFRGKNWRKYILAFFAQTTTTSFLETFDRNIGFC
jgi:hypothetical protein